MLAFYLALLWSSTTLTQCMAGTSSTTVCGAHVSDSICSPNGDIWTMHTQHNITWNPMNQVYRQLNSIDIILSCVVDSHQEVLKTWNNIQVKSGYLEIYVDSTFFPNVPVGGSRIWSAYLGITSNETSNETSNISDLTLPLPTQLTLQVDARLNSDRPAFDIDDNQNNNSAQDSPLIDNSVLIAIASVLGASVILCVIIAIWCYRRPLSENHQKREENAVLPDKETKIEGNGVSTIPTESFSTNSPYQLQMNPSQFTQFSNIYSDDSFVQPSELSTDIHAFTEPLPRALEQNAHGKLKSLTSTDAVLLGEMFRQKMRSPDWATDSQVTEVEPAEQPAFGSKLINQLRHADHLNNVVE